MQIIQKSTDSIELVTDIAANVDYLVSYLDIDDATFEPIGGDTSAGNITTATTTTILAAPSADIRTPKYISIRNKHASQSVGVIVQFDRSATNRELHAALVQPGECLQFVEGQGWLVLAAPSSGYGDVIERILDSTQTGSNATGAQNWFPTNGAANVEAGTVYEFEGVLNMTRSAGASSHTTSLQFGGTATLTSILWRASCNTGDTLANAAQNHAAGRSASAVVVKAASTSTTEEVSLHVQGTIKVNAAGTFIPQFSYSAAPGGAPTMQLGSFFKLTKKGAGFNTRGTWA